MNSRPILAAALGVAVLAATLLVPISSNGQAGAEDAALPGLIAEITAQQATIAEQQARIDAKLAVIAEDLRIARIYVGRGGGKTK